MATPGAAIESASRAHTKPLLLPSDRWSALEIAFWLIPVVAFFAFPNYRVLGSQVAPGETSAFRLAICGAFAN